MDRRTVPTDLRTEFTKRPVGVESDRPRFNWNPGGTQTAYQVRVAPSHDALDGSPTWDSGRVTTDKCTRVRYDGPSLESGERYVWTVRVWTDAGVSEWSDPEWWETGLDADDWEADWIRGPPIDEGDEAQFRLLRTEFDLDDDIEDACAYVAACHQCAVWVNGTEVGRGQSFCYPDEQYYKSYDVTDELRAGRANAIGVQHVWTGRGKGRPHGEPGLLVQLCVDYADGSSETVVTDGSWATRDGPTDPGPERSPAAREPIERFDGRQDEQGWTEPGFGDTDWNAPSVVGSHPTEPWTRLVGQQREVVRDELEPQSIRRLDDGTVVADFGRVYAGVPVVTFEDGTAGHDVVVRCGYRLDDDGRVSTTEGIQWTDMHYEYVQRDGEQTFRPFVFLAFRYLEIEHPGEDVRDNVAMLKRRNGVPDERAAAFDSSDDVVDNVWELARHSALYGSQEQFLDTPTREKGQFVSDSLDISMTTMAAFRERKLTQQALREFCDSHERYWEDEGRVNAVYPTGEGKRDIPDYSEWFVEWVWQYYRETGDIDLLERTFPVLEAISEYVAADVDDETGLVTKLSGGDRDEYRHGIVDWPEEMRYGYDMETTAKTTVNVLAVVVFRRVAEAARKLDRFEAASRNRERARSLETAINGRLRRRDGIYVDGLRDDGSRSEHASQHANAFPLAFDIPDDSVDAVADHVAAQGMAMGPMTAYWLLAALDAVDRHDTLVDRITATDEDGWANILASEGTFTWESWKARELPDDERYIVSESHAWGATVLVAIQRFLLGVRPVDPGGTRIVVSPPNSGLRRAEGDVPTEQGPVSVAWTRDDEADPSRIELDLEVPPTVTATVRLPTPDPERVDVTVGGTECWTGGTVPSSLPAFLDDVAADDGAVDVTVTGGSHRMALGGHSD